MQTGRRSIVFSAERTIAEREYQAIELADHTQLNSVESRAWRRQIYVEDVMAKKQNYIT